jgi:hypothetical protein
MPSTRDTSSLPDIHELRLLSQSLALLDAILEPEWQYRYYSFNTRWAPGLEMGSMRDGCGNDYFILFSQHGAILKGLSLESESWRVAKRRGQIDPGIFGAVPSEFAEFLVEPAFTIDESTFCLWCLNSDLIWRKGSLEPLDEEDPDGSAEVLRLLDGNPETYHDWAIAYHEKPIDLWAVQRIYHHEPLDDELVKRLNPDLSIVELADDLGEIAYPSVTG